MANWASRSFFMCGAALLGAVLAAPVSAADIFPGVVIRDVSITNKYSYTFGETQPPSTIGGTQSTIAVSDQRPIPASQLGVDFVGRADVDSFYFLHNDYCVGQCQITSSTTIRFEIFNGFGEDLQGLRFDSLITPGHLALVGLGSYENTAASFAFTVSRTDVQPTGAPGSPVDLYTANGYSDITGLGVEANGVKDPFANTITGDNGGAGLYYDWSATPLNVELGLIFDRQTIYLDYTATYSVKSFNKCDDIMNCNAAQVVFGDPRNTGGGTHQRSSNAMVGDPIDGGVHAVITREYDETYIPYAFVLSGSDPSFTADPQAPITYVGNYIPTLKDTVPGVPEPATWAIMILGFGAIGGALRHRRVGPRKAFG